MCMSECAHSSFTNQFCVKHFCDQHVGPLSHVPTCQSQLSSLVSCCNNTQLTTGLRKNEETRIDAVEMKGLRKILRVSWTAKKTNEWVLNKAGVKRKLLDTVKARKLAYYGQTMRKRGRWCLEKEIMQGTMPGALRWGRPRAAWMDNIKKGTEM